ncbi:MAG: site-specific integrase, partial [Eubacteriales bacterium]|nr:site-specific integrase [Eubacteriales bacterium]
TFFTWLHSEGYIARNPVGRGGVKAVETDRFFMTAEDEVRVRDVKKTVKEDALIDFLFSTGVRVGELVNMNVSDINPADGTVTFQGEKGSRRFRTVLLDAAARRHLEDYLQTRTDGNPALFVTNRAYGGAPRRMNRAGIEKMTKDIGKKAGLTRPLTVHVFRRTLATRLADMGCPMEVIQEILGHREPKTTMHYIQQSRGRLIRKASQYFGAVA